MKKYISISQTERLNKYYNSESGFLTTKIKDIYKPSALKQRGYVPECSKSEIKKYFYEYVEKNGRNCFYCKKPWTYITNEYIHEKKQNKKNKSDKGKTRENKIRNLSFDRFDNSKTYSIDNIVFCCTQCNLSKKDISISLIKRLYEIITERNL